VDAVIAADAIEVSELAGDAAAAYALIASPTPDRGPALLRLETQTAVSMSTAGVAIGNSVHGYGLHSLAAMPGGVVACERESTNLQLLLADGETRTIEVDVDGAIGDPVWHATSRHVLAVHAEPGKADRLIDIGSVGDSRTVFESDGMLARPVCGPDDRVACIGWQLPWMPWQQSSLWAGSMQAGSFARVPTPAGAAVAQPMFTAHGQLYFLCDATGYFELWRFDGRDARPVTQLDADIGLSLSRQTSRSVAFLGEDRAVAVVWRRGVSELCSLDLASGATSTLQTHSPPADQVLSRNGCLWYTTLPTEGAVAIRSIDSSQSDRAVWNAPAVDSPAAPAPITVTLDAADGARIDSFVFRAVPERRRGILLINLHGGPNSLAPRRLKGALRLLRDDGFDVVELNYRGSAGFGRRYRSRLDGQWGVADVEDVLALSRHLEKLGVASRARTLLRGASAGGYTVLNTLCRHDGFAGGIAYCGISDLQALGTTTHAYESGLLKHLAGAADLADPRFIDRSPIHRAEHISAPLLLLQGAADRVTPPEQSVAIAKRMRAHNRSVQLHIFDDEGHGFTRLETLRRCASLERDFLIEATRHF
jgi:dipeptidyl aminopeptidase/acylaminoacyl peptidase